MKKNGLVSSYTVKQYKVNKIKYSNDNIDNQINSNFNQEQALKIVFSNLTYVNVDGKGNYIYLMLGLYNRGIIVYTARKMKMPS